MSERIRILVVEANLADRLAIRKAIEQSGLGAEIEDASTAAEALDKALGKAAGRFDCWMVFVLVSCRY